MPCQCDYMQANEREIESKRVAQLLCYILPLVDRRTDPEIRKAAKEYYGNRKFVDAWTKELCSVLEALTEGQLNAIVYDGYNPTARQLADWWDIHKEHDRTRELDISKKEKQKKHDDLFKKIQKLSDEEAEELLKIVIDKLRK